MAELATIARPYAEALFESAGANASSLVEPLHAVAAVAANAELRQFADHPKAVPAQVVEVIAGVVGGSLAPALKNLLALIVENGRLNALPEIAAQFRALVNATSGVSDARITSAFPIGDAQLADVVASLERRFGRKLKASVAVDASLIGGIRVEVGDEVLDTSVQARLDQMRVALTA
jgi:F-type H+-transporting ATPase subunit delta